MKKIILICILTWLCAFSLSFSDDKKTSEKHKEAILFRLKQSHSGYLKNEAPAKSNLFFDVCFDLNLYSKESPVSKADVKKWLGQPDLPPDDFWHMDDFTYLWHNDKASNKLWSASFYFSSNVLETVGYSPADKDLLETIKKCKAISEKNKK